MKNFLVLLAFSLVFWSCGTSVDDILPDEPEAIGEFNITGSKTTSSTSDYPTELLYLVQGSGETAISSLQVSIGNIGQTDDVIVINLNELGNENGFQVATYNYTSDADANLQLISYYVDESDTWQITENATSLTNRLTITSITNNKVKGNFEFNFQKVLGTELINVTGSFEGASVF